MQFRSRHQKLQLQIISKHYRQDMTIVYNTCIDLFAARISSFVINYLQHCLIHPLWNFGVNEMKRNAISAKQRSCNNTVSLRRVSFLKQAVESTILVLVAINKQNTKLVRFTLEILFFQVPQLLKSNYLLFATFISISKYFVLEQFLN